MIFRRPLSTATSLIALGALAATPAVAADAAGMADIRSDRSAGTATVMMEPGEGTVILREIDRAEPPHADIQGLIVTEGNIVGAGNGFKTNLVRSDTWEPGFRKADDGDYVKIAEETPQATLAEGSQWRIVRSDTWEPGFRKTEDGDYYRLMPVDRNYDTADIAVMVEPAGQSAAQIVPIVTPLDDPSNVMRQQFNVWEPGTLHDGDGQYYRYVIYRRSAPAEEMPDFQ